MCVVAGEKNGIYFFLIDKVITSLSVYSKEDFIYYIIFPLL